MVGALAHAQDVKSYLRDDVHWDNVAFEKARANPLTADQYAALEASW